MRDAETEAMIRAVAHSLVGEAGLDPAAIRVTLLHAWAIDAFAHTGNRRVAAARPVRPAAARPARARARMVLSDGAAAPMVAARAEPGLPAGPSRPRPRDIPEASRRNMLPPGRRAAEQARRRRERR